MSATCCACPNTTTTSAVYITGWTTGANTCATCHPHVDYVLQHAPEDLRQGLMAEFAARSPAPVAVCGCGRACLAAPCPTCVDDLRDDQLAALLTATRLLSGGMKKHDAGAQSLSRPPRHAASREVPGT